MKYIKRVILENFQSHKYTVVDLDSRLNVIVGPSDSGKTAILRGIKWALYNEPSGDYFIREGESECAVTIIFSDDTKIKRYRSKSKNTYYLYDELDTELKFEGFGTNVPDEILEATGIKKILLDKSVSKTINISDQLEGAFLLSEKGSIRASSIGYLVGVDIIDDALKETLRESRSLSNNKRIIDDNIIKLEKDLSKYDYLDALSKKVSKLENIFNKIDYKEKQLVKYKEILLKTSEIKAETLKLNIYLKKLRNFHDAEHLFSNIELKLIKYKQLNKQNLSLKKTKVNMQVNNKIVTSLANIDVVKENIDKISILLVKKYKLNIINKNIKLTSNNMKIYKNIINKLINLDMVENNIEKINNNNIQLKVLSQIKKKIINVKHSLSIGSVYISKLNEIDRISDQSLKIEKKLNTINHLIKLSSNFYANRKAMAKLNNEIINYKNKFDILSSEYKDILLKEGTCPLCFSDIDSEKANHIIDQYK